MDRTPHSPRARRAFTLVELLTVIVIIGILAGLITAAAVRGRVRTKVLAVKSEVTQLAMAVEAYKEKYGEYPPDFTDLGALERHLKRAFPRYRYRGERNYPGFPLARQFLDDVAIAYGYPAPALPNPVVTDVDQASALVVFLGGVPEQPGATKPAGFHADPQRPFRNGTPRTQPLFTEFDATRLTITPGNALVCQYRPAGAAQPAPYVYFKSRRVGLPVATPQFQYDEFAFVDSGGVVHPLSYPPFSSPVAPYGYCVPYLEFNPTASVSTPLDPTQQLVGGVNPRQWPEAGKFQIVSAGLDGLFGNALVGGSPQEFRYRKLGLNFSDDGGDFDNVTNFSEGTLEDELE